MPDDPMNPSELRRLTQPLLADPVIGPTPLAEIRHRAARRHRQRAGALTIAAVVLLAVGGTALALAGRPSPSERVGTETPTTVEVRLPLTVWIQPTATPGQVAAIRAALMADPEVTTLVYQDQDATYRQFACLFATQPGLVHSVEPSELPPSFGIVADDGQPAIDEVARRVAPLAGVKEVAAVRPFTVPLDLSTTTSFGQQPLSSAQIQQLELRLQEAKRSAATSTTQPVDPRCAYAGTTLKG